MTTSADTTIKGGVLFRLALCAVYAIKPFSSSNLAVFKTPALPLLNSAWTGFGSFILLDALFGPNVEPGVSFSFIHLGWLERRNEKDVLSYQNHYLL
jgi:hypothetical protein